MSSSSVCHGLQSCLEPRVIEPRVLRLKLAPPGSNFSTCSGKASSQDHVTNHECGDKKDTISNVGGSGWSFLQSLTHTSHCNKTEDPQVYVHPTVKRSSSMLSEKSLEMCTESLGSETGSNAGESSDDISLLSLESSTCFTRHDTNKTCVSKRVNRAASFPPPLTSITDFEVRHHREDGRLILEAVASPSPRPCFHADRSDGRLRLRLLETYYASQCDDDDEVADEEWNHDDEEEEDEAENEEGCGVEENEEDEMGVTKFGRPSRCKESGNRVRDIFVELPSLSLCL